MSSAIVDSLRDKAKTYEINSAAATERGDATSAVAFSTVACVLLEMAETFEHELEEAA